MIPVEERREIIDAITFPASGRTIDRFVHAVLGRMTFGVSPAAAILAYLDWLAHRDGAGQAGGARAGSRRP